jgi:hypothetical protein
MYTCMHTYTHTHTYIYTYTDISYIYTYIHTYILQSEREESLDKITRLEALLKLAEEDAQELEGLRCQIRQQQQQTV